MGMGKYRMVEIIVTGNEILEGDILDTNSNWICKQITGMGGKGKKDCHSSG
jgi:Predicted nucleotide-utilizing enzyme related to molybdopterin-biosynthesis enzyme MoeA